MLRWLDEHGRRIDVIARLKEAEESGRVDRRIDLARHKAAPLAVRLVAVGKPPVEIAKSLQKAPRNANKDGEKLAGETLIAFAWVLLLTSLAADQFSAGDICELYRVRWRIEMAFKRLKSLVGLAGPPGEDPDVAKTWILAHLLMVLLLEAHIAVVEDSPRRGQPRLAA